MVELRDGPRHSAAQRLLDDLLLQPPELGLTLAGLVVVGGQVVAERLRDRPCRSSDRTRHDPDFVVDGEEHDAGVGHDGRL